MSETAFAFPGKTAFIFPGQGAQYTGMGQGFYETYECSRKIFELADTVSQISMRQLIFEGDTRLHETKYTQIAMLCAELAILAAVKENGFEADVYAGLSLGEYAALAGLGALTAEDAFGLIVKRGAFMQEAAPTGGAMMAIMGLSNEKIAGICKETAGIVSVANYNCPDQTVITGEEVSVAMAAKSLQAAGAKKCVPLKVSGPFHSILMENAGKKLAATLENIQIHPFTRPYVSNVTASYITDPEEVKSLLVRQISSPVCWQQSVECMIARGVDTFIEIGPKKTLSGFLKKINPKIKSYHIEVPEDIAQVMSKIESNKSM